jgi:predicted DNA-binding transcriptional regulator AlpA
VIGESEELGGYENGHTEKRYRNMEPELISVRTLSQLLDISEKTIWDWIYKSRRQPTLDPIPYHKLGGLVRFNLREIRAWVARRRVRPEMSV